jgi:hypothetical protein
MHWPPVDWGKWFGISTGLLTPLIAIMALYIARQQWVTNRRQLRLALFERRLAVYNSTKAIIVVVIQRARLEMDDVFKLDYETREHEFLFGSDISAYLKEVRDKALELYLLDVPSPKPAAERTELVKWFLLQSNEARKKFGRYMAFQDPE